jgi:flagellar biosynthesis/type III secretory pathway ATPase
VALETLPMHLTADEVAHQLSSVMPTSLTGSVVRTAGMTAAVAGFPAPVGALVEIERDTGGPLAGEVIGFRDELTLVYLMADAAGVRHGNRVRLVKTSRYVRVGEGLLGRVINARGACIDGKPQPALAERVPLDRPAVAAIDRPRIDAPLSTGIRAIDGLLTCGKGQRIGIFAGSGVGKSVTLGMMSAKERSGRCHERRARARSRASRARGYRGCGVLSRPGSRCALGHGLAYPLGARSARNRPGRGRAACHARLSAVGIRAAS